MFFRRQIYVQFPQVSPNWSRIMFSNELCCFMTLYFKQFYGLRDSFSAPSFSYLEAKIVTAFLIEGYTAKVGAVDLLRAHS